MTLWLYRKAKTVTYTIGRLYFDCTKCDTLEPPVRALLDLNGDGDFNDAGEGKVYGQTAIPLGSYRVKMQMSPTFKRMMPYLQKVSGFTNVMIHPGNTAEDTKGCILIGENTSRGKLTNSRGWSDMINTKITDAENRGENVWITITEE